MKNFGLYGYSSASRLPHTQTSLSLSLCRWKVSRWGRREEENKPDLSSFSSRGPLSFVTSHSCFVLTFVCHQRAKTKVKPMVQTAIRSYTSKLRQNFTRQHERRKLISLGKKCNCALQSESSQFILLNTHHVKEKQGLIKVRVLLRVLDDCRMNHMSTTLKLNTWRRHTGQLISLHVTHAPTQHLRKKTPL